jgi:hypothetical protein
MVNGISATRLRYSSPLASARWVCWLAQEAEERCCQCGRLIKPPYYISERPPQSGLSVWILTKLTPLCTARQRLEIKRLG